MTASNRITEDLKTIRRLTVGSAAIIVCLVGVFWLQSTETDRQFAQDRATGRIGACAQANELTQRARQSAEDQAKVLIAASNAGRSAPSAEQQARIDAYLANQIAAAKLTFPLRDCTPAGIDAFYENAPPAEPCANGGDRRGFCKP